MRKNLYLATQLSGLYFVWSYSANTDSNNDSYKELNVVAGFIGLMMFVLLLIYAVGRYVGISVFMLVLLRLIARESWRLSVVLTACVALSIYLLFEHGFNIELNRGVLNDLLLRYESLGLD